MLVHAGPFGNIAHGNSSVLADLIGIHSRRLPHHRGRLRRRHGGRAVLQHQVPHVGPRPGRRGGRGDRTRPEGALGQAPHRRRQAAARRRCWPRTPTRCTIGGANLRKQIENIRHPRRVAGRRDQRLPQRPSRASTRRSARSPRRPAPACAVSTPLRRRRAGRRRAGRGGGRGGRGAQRRSACSTPTTPRLREKIETVATKVYGADGVDYSPLATRQLDTYETQRLRRPAGVHRQDPPVDLVGPGAARARRPAGGCRCARCGRRSAPASSTRSAATCGRCPASAAHPAALRIDIDADGTITGLS